MLRSVAVLLTALGLGAASVAPAAAWEPAGGASFNNPNGNHDARWRIIDNIDRAVSHAKPGSKVLVSTYLMDSKASADALIAAHDRGVAIQMVMDGNDADTGQGLRLARALNRDNIKGAPTPVRWGLDNSFVVFCKGSCRGGEHNNHSKFYVFTHTGTASNVVMVSSSNLNKGGAARGWNDMYTAKENPRLVDHYSGIHAEMAQDTPADGDRYRQYVDGHFVSRFYPKPSGTDPVMDDLSKVHCKGADGGSGHNGRTAINIAMFAWNSDRGTAIAKRLVALDKLGCDVAIIYGAPSSGVRDILARSARNGGVKLWDSRVDRDGDGIFDVRVHHKFMLINGHYGADTSAWRVHAGSQNWGRGTLRGGDENTLNIVSRTAYRQYLDHWDVVRTHGARRIGR